MAITLPSNPNVGDVIAVSGTGTGGFTIVPNGGQFIHVRGVPIRPTQRLFVSNWRAGATSADGMKLIAADGDRYLWTSTDGGENWTQRSALRTLGVDTLRIVSSADGSKLLAGTYDGTIYSVYVSSDSGATWQFRNDANRPQFELAGDCARWFEGFRQRLCGKPLCVGRVGTQLDCSVH